MSETQVETRANRAAMVGWLAAILGLLFAFWPLVRMLPSYWFDLDSYYSHGVLIPAAAGYILWHRWPKEKLESKGSWIGMAVLIPTLYLAWIVSRTEMPLLMSGALLVACFGAVLFVAGWKWLKVTAPAIGYLALGLPVLDRFVDPATFRLQLISTDLAAWMLKVSGLKVLKLAPTELYLDHYTLRVVEACSGLKTTIAVTAMVIFLLLTSRLRWWWSLTLCLIAIPLSVFANGLRIALIGRIGETKGAEAAVAWHSPSGWIVLVVCIGLLVWISRATEVKE
jgi:exosortase